MGKVGIGQLSPEYYQRWQSHDGDVSTKERVLKYDKGERVSCEVVKSE